MATTDEELTSLGLFAFEAAKACLAIALGADPTKPPGPEWARASSALCAMIDEIQSQATTQSKVLETVKRAYSSNEEAAPFPGLYLVSDPQGPDKS